jgi:hypothetical protein
MSERHVLDELSAYIDGEARHPERIARHLRHCAGCARRHMELLKLSAHVAALPAPPDNPDLIGKVLAEIGRHQAAHEARPRLLAFPVRRLIPLAAAAALALAAGLGWLALRPESVPENTRLAENPELADEAVVVRLVGLIESGDDLAYFDDAQAGPAIEAPAVVEPLPVDGLLLALAALAADDPEPAFFAGDVYDDLESLEEAEAAAFGELLTNYINEG